MIWKNISFKITKALVFLLFLFTILLTTPWGTQVTISLLNNIDGLEIDYKAGALVRDIELNVFELNLKNIDIHLEDLTTNINFACTWQKKLCIDSLKVGEFSLVYIDKKNNRPKNEPVSKAKKHLFVMPFAIEADSVSFIKSHIVVNQTVIDLEHLAAEIEINKSKFSILQPSVRKLTFTTNKSKNNVKDTENSVQGILSLLPEVYLPISLNIQQLFVDELDIIERNEDFTGTLQKTERFLFTKNHLTGTWTKSNVKLKKVKTSTLNYVIDHLALNTQLIPPYKIKASLTAQLLNVTGWPEISNSTVDMTLQGAFDDLTAQVTSQGNLVMNSQGHFNLTHQRLPFELKLQADKLPLPLSLTKYGKPARLSFDVSGDLVKQTINLSSSFTGYGYKAAQVKLRAEHHQGYISLNELRFHDKNSNSQLNVRGDIDLQSAEKKWQLFAHSPGLTLPEIKLKPIVTSKNTNGNSNQIKTKTNKNTTSKTGFIDSLLPDVINGRLLGEISSTGHWSESQWSLSVNNTDVSGTLNNTPLNIQGDIALNESGHLSSGNLPQGQLVVTFDKDQLILQTFDDNTWHVDGQLFIAEMSSWYRDTRGSFFSDFTISGNKKDPIIALNGKFNSLHWQKFNSPRLEVVTSYQPFNHHKTQLSVKSSRLHITDKNKTETINDIALNVHGDLFVQTLQLDWQGDITGKLALTGQWQETLNHWQSTIEYAGLTYKQQTWRNNAPFSLSFDLNEEQLLIDKHCWQGKGLNLCLPLDTRIGKNGDLTLALNIDLSLLGDLILPEEVKLNTKLSGEIDAQWSGNQPLSVKTDLFISQGDLKVYDQYSEQKITQWQQGDLSLTLNNTQFISNFLLYDNQGQAFINTHSKIDLIDDFPIDAKVEINQFNLQPFQTIVNNIIKLEGQLTALLSVKGNLKSPLINGDLALDNSELLLSQTANKLENISAGIDIKNNQAKILGQFFIKDKKAEFNGQFAWQDDLTMDIDLFSNQLPLVFPPLLVFNISPSLNFSLKQKVLKITGVLDILSGQYNIEKLPEGSIKLSDDVIIVDQVGKQVINEKLALEVETNVQININKAFKVSGQGLESHLFGELQITQQNKKPLQLFGNIRSDQGTYHAYGQRLNIDKGELTFNGQATNPYFNLTATRQIKSEDIEVGIQINGLADALEMQLFSTPTMEAPEMLSYLARGRGLDSGSGNSTAAASMLIGFGVTNSVGLFDQLDKLPLISNIAVDTEGEGDTTQAIISGYIGNRIYLKYGIGVYEPISELTVRLYLLNRFWLEVVSGIEQSSDLYYSFDVD